MNIQVLNVIIVSIIICEILITVKGSLKKLKFIIDIILLTILPLVLCFISSNFNYSLGVDIIFENNIARFIGVVSFCILVILRYLWLLISINVFPYSKIKVNKNDEVSVRLSRIDKAIKVTGTGIYFMIICLIYGLTLGCLVYVFRMTVENIFIVFLVISSFPGALLITFPMAIYISSIIIGIIVILLVINYIFIINGTLRLVVSSEVIRKNAPIYIVLMLIPIINIISSLVISNKAKKSLRMQHRNSKGEVLIIN